MFNERVSVTRFRGYKTLWPPSVNNFGFFFKSAADVSGTEKRNSRSRIRRENHKKIATAPSTEDMTKNSREKHFAVSLRVFDFIPDGGGGIGEILHGINRLVFPVSRPQTLENNSKNKRFEI